MPPYNRYNGWLPSNPAVYDAFVANLFKRGSALKYRQLEGRIGEEHVPPVQEFGDVIRQSTVMKNLFDKIIEQASQPRDSTRRIESLDDLLYLLDPIVGEPPKFVAADPALDPSTAEPVGVPMYLLFDIISNTSAAYDLFRMEEFNAALKKLLNAWGTYLQTLDSASTLVSDYGGWFSPQGMGVLQSAGRGSFDQTYVSDPSKPHRGYKSWDDFFTRAFQDGVRPLELPPGSQRDRMIFNACESTVERWRHGVKAHDRFWLKGMSYSLSDMFQDENLAKEFEGGTVYQAFLSPQDYHRWHSPIDGTVELAKIVDGTYYAVLPDEGWYDDEVEPSGALIRCQPWLSQSSTRAVFVIKGSEYIGRVAFIAIGMAEVSTCAIKIEPDPTIEQTSNEKPIVHAGDQLGMFHFGGSSHVLVFQHAAKIQLRTEDQVVVRGRHIQLRRNIGVSVA
ncbi:phosphatidylserine decarboxylase family protein [Rhizoctonia solani AG-3 Rhs1AP]|uniref:Phosphatidylserine decarboxylase family protein n=2 Tax=Rhizoctonia solani AG-3 TaxID=1086053 RepID=A0A074RED4_9AGAM|nr:phosphatidylserine decarboxylase family protein [Rhizoctonia solani AG-3 Rhs1AP]KEP45159.1 phosphatidylserine decarboxylase family protein [Rhizoctonia solani 123E]